MERGIARPGSRLAQQALRVGRLSLARRLIAQHLSRAELSPTLVADMLGISVRHVHMLFETAEMSFSQTVTALRLDHSRRLLREAPQRPIADIAHACGFESLATFYRVFNAAVSMTPGDYRTQPA
ncbi:helix-turn-helix transcriptional regulator [Bradyrhizobium sp. LTSPM299]